MTTPELADTLDRIATAIYLTHDESKSLRQAAAALRAGVPEVSELRKVAKRNLRSLIERDSADKALMLSCLEELS